MRKVQRSLRRFQGLMRLKTFKVFLRTFNGLFGEGSRGSWRRSKAGHVVNVTVLWYRSGYVQSGVNGREKTLSALQ